MVNSAQAVRCFEPSDIEQDVSGLIEISYLEHQRSPLVEVSLSMPENYDDYEVSSLSLSYVEKNSENLAIIYPYRLIENGFVKSSLFVKSEELEYWFATVIYLKPKDPNVVINDGCLVKSTSNLKRNKFTASGSDASSTRPF